MFIFNFFLCQFWLLFLLNQHQRWRFLSFLHCPRSNNLFRGQKVKCKLDRLKFLHIAPCLDDEEHLVIFAVMRKLFLKCWIHIYSSRLFLSLSLFVALTPALKRLSQSDPVQCFYLQYNLPDIFMTFVFWMKDFFQKYSAVNYYYCYGCYCYGSTVIFLMAYCFSMTVVSQPRAICKWVISFIIPP